MVLIVLIMNILYGVAGVGYGHSSRALLVIRHLEKAGHKVKVITYGDGYRALKDEFDCIEANSLDLVFDKGVVKKRKTVSKNVKNVSKELLNWPKFHKMVRKFKPSVCITDMESIVPIISYWNSIPLISIDNQHALTNLKTRVPWRHMKSYIIAKRIVDRIVHKADTFIVSSFGGAKIRKKNTVIIPPIVRGEIQKLKPKYGKKVLVYLSKSDEGSLNVLRNLNEEFVVYGFDKAKKKGNIEFRKRGSFLRDLSSCKCVIGTAGFSLMGEAIYLNKPYLAIPLKGQFEQISNALFLEGAGFGGYCKKLNEKDVVYFLYHLDKYRRALEKCDFDQGKLFRTIDSCVRRFEGIKVWK